MRRLSLALMAAVAPPLGAQAARVPTLDTVLIETETVFGGRPDALSWYERLANAVHVTTRPSVIRRELLLGAGLPYDSARVAETARNLRALGVFRFVEIDTVRVGDRLAARVRTGDGWSTKPHVALRVTGSQARYAVGFREENFLGTATLAAVLFRHSPDRNALTAAFRQPRFLGTPVVTAALYEDLTDGRRGLWEVERPFTHLAARLTFGTSGEAGTTRLLRFREGALDAAFRRKLFRAGAFVGWAPIADPRGYVRLLLEGQVRREDIVPDTVASLPRSVTGAVGAGIEYRHARFVVVDHYNTFARREDVDLSSLVRLEWWWTPSTLGYAQTGRGPLLRAQTGGTWGRSFFRVGIDGHAIYRAGAVDSGAVRATGTFVVQGLPRQTLILHGQAGAMKRPLPGAEFDLGLGEGPRAFGSHAFTGTRMLWGTVEHRVYLVDDWLDLVGLGFAVFADYGGAWYADAERRLGGDVGIGLRIGASRAARAELARVDLAYRFGEGFEGSRWAVVVGRGVAF